MAAVAGRGWGCGDGGRSQASSAGVIAGVLAVLRGVHHPRRPPSLNVQPHLAELENDCHSTPCPEMVHCLPSASPSALTLADLVQCPEQRAPPSPPVVVPQGRRDLGLMLPGKVSRSNVIAWAPKPGGMTMTSHRPCPSNGAGIDLVPGCFLCIHSAVTVILRHEALVHALRMLSWRVSRAWH